MMASASDSNPYRKRQDQVVEQDLIDPDDRA